ncbi:MAG: FxsA family protein [Kiritimatiellae bacterium]|nr:FxsA family protein [Kiritimatiellia bacterium]
MLSYLIAAFILIPIAELAVLLHVKEVMGLGNTILLVVLTGFGGAILAKWQGLMVMSEINRDMAQGKMPAPHMIDGVMILVAGLMLITPGLITDSVGFLLLIPIVRKELRIWLRRKIEHKFTGNKPDITTQ